MRASHLEDFYSFLRFPSISTDDQYAEKLTECAHWLVKKLTSVGLETQLVSTHGHPVVWARNQHRQGRRTVLIYGHYDVQPPDPLELWDSPPFEPIWARPTAEINGIGGGYQGKRTKTVIASHAMAKLTFRLVPNQEGDEILKLARAHLRKNLPKGVTLDITDGHSGPWYLTDPHSPDGEAAQRALHKAFNAEVALIREGGSIPIVSQFRSILGVETLLMGLAPADCRAHSPNENFPLENLESGIRLNKAVLQELAR